MHHSGTADLHVDLWLRDLQPKVQHVAGGHGPSTLSLANRRLYVAPKFLIGLTDSY